MDFEVLCNEKTGGIQSIKLYGDELLDTDNPSPGEFYVNDIPLELRRVPFNGEGLTEGNDNDVLQKGERFVNQFSAWSLVLNRLMGGRPYMKYNCFGINYWIRREEANITCPVPGPGGPVVEAPLYADSLSLLNVNWKFWGEDTRMIFPSTHSMGPEDEFGHCGYEHDTPKICKSFLQNVYRRVYPGNMVIHGGLFYNVKTGEWLALTCRRPHISYILNIENAGLGVSYDFKLHTEIKMGELIRMPEIKIYYGKTKDEMNSWLADYVTFYYEEPPEWVFKTAWTQGLAWTNKPTWVEQADEWEKDLDRGLYNGISYSLVTSRPISSGTTPLNYMPDPNHGTIQEFIDMCHRIRDRGVPFTIWMSHTGLAPGYHEIDDDWFIRGADGKLNASWGCKNNGMMTINPGHPGYIEYTKKWITFYIKECGAKGIFMDCLGWSFPPDYKKRDFMRYPSDTNIMAVKFINEIYAHIKSCDPEAILLGEGTTLDAPINILSVHTNSRKASDGMGPRDFLLSLNKHSKKTIVVDQSPFYTVSSGMCVLPNEKKLDKHNKFMVELLKEKGKKKAFTHMTGDLSIMEDILILPYIDCKPLSFTLSGVSELKEVITGKCIKSDGGGDFCNVEFGIYKIINIC